MSINSVLYKKPKLHISIMRKMIAGMLIAIVCATLNTRAQDVFTLLQGYKLPQFQYDLVNWIPTDGDLISVTVIAESFGDETAMVFFNTDDGRAMASGFNLKQFLADVAKEKSNPGRYYDLGYEKPLVDKEGKEYFEVQVGDPQQFFLFGNKDEEFDADHQCHVDIYIDPPKKMALK